MSPFTSPRLLAASVLTAAAALTSAQTTARPAAKPATAATHHAAAATTPAAEPTCVKVSELSPKIPAVPEGTPCAKAMFTFTTRPSVTLDYVSPLVASDIREGLGLDPQTFSLDYQEIKVGTGELAAAHKFYTVHYTGYLLDGTKFDSSVDRNEPFSFPIGAHQVVPGWDLGLQGMRVGGKRRLFIPYQLGYGDRGKPPIPPKAEMVFDIELLSQSDNQPAPKAPPAAPGASAAPSSNSAPSDSTSPRPATPATSANPNNK
jgi:peptidylprolyl isomerase